MINQQTWAGKRGGQGVLRAKASGRFSEISPAGSRVRPTASHGFPGTCEGFVRKTGWMGLAVVWWEQGLVQPLELSSRQLPGLEKLLQGRCCGAIRAELDLCGAASLGKGFGASCVGEKGQGCAKATHM